MDCNQIKLLIYKRNEVFIRSHIYVNKLTPCLFVFLVWIIYRVWIGYCRKYERKTWIFIKHQSDKIEFNSEYGFHEKHARHVTLFPCGHNKDIEIALAFNLIDRCIALKGIYGASLHKIN